MTVRAVAVFRHSPRPPLRKGAAVVRNYRMLDEN